MRLPGSACNPSTQTCAFFCGKPEEVARKLGLLDADGKPFSSALSTLLAKLTDVIASAEQVEEIVASHNGVRKDYEGVQTAVTVCRWVSSLLDYLREHGSLVLMEGD
ncbi:MAG: hypothetical protein N2512_08935 [Armatimonadetes bacterium]|nr:hypothetical protein [Armatimonadota bacterium]